VSSVCALAGNIHGGDQISLGLIHGKPVFIYHTLTLIRIPPYMVLLSLSLKLSLKRDNLEKFSSSTGANNFIVMVYVINLDAIAHCLEFTVPTDCYTIVGKTPTL